MNVGPINHDDFCLECGSSINHHESPPERVYLQWHHDDWKEVVAYQINQCDPAYIRESPKVAAAIAAHDALVEELRKAQQLAQVALDWNLDEVEIDGEMVSVYELYSDFRATLALAEAKP